MPSWKMSSSDFVMTRYFQEIWRNLGTEEHFFRALQIQEPAYGRPGLIMQIHIREEVDSDHERYEARRKQFTERSANNRRGDSGGNGQSGNARIPGAPITDQRGAGPNDLRPDPSMLHTEAEAPNLQGDEGRADVSYVEPGEQERSSGLPTRLIGAKEPGAERAPEPKRPKSRKTRK